QQAKEEERRVVEEYERREVGLARKREAEEDGRGTSKARLLGNSGSGALVVRAGGAGAGAGGAGKKRGESSFWVPEKAPGAESKASDPSGRSVRCWASSLLPDGHALKLKHLVPVVFRSVGGEKLCPSCDRAFGNSSKIDVLRPCGHALCHRCVANFVVPAGRCFVCEAAVDAEKDAVRLHSEGTGFSGGGGQMVAERYDHALQA
ncbi:hypothetical protein LPJ56_007003, partial [Coemansia sp. RSA 2599]